MKKIKIISDLHISDEQLDTNFQLDEGNFITYLKKTVEDCDMFILNGDIFELWETKVPFLKKGKFHRLMRGKPNLFRYIHSLILRGKLIYIYGNHDYFLKTSKFLLAIHKKLLLTINSCKIYVSHGHQPDLWNNGLARLGEFFTWLGAWFERLFFFNIDSKIISNCIRRELVMLKYAKIKAKKYKADIVVLGHLHKYTKREDENFTYVTTGKVCGNEDSFDEVTIEVEKDGSYDVKHRKVSL